MLQGVPCFSVEYCELCQPQRWILGRDVSYFGMAHPCKWYPCKSCKCTSELERTLRAHMSAHASVSFLRTAHFYHCLALESNTSITNEFFGPTLNKPRQMRQQTTPPPSRCVLSCSRIELVCVLSCSRNELVCVL